MTNIQKKKRCEITLCPLIMSHLNQFVFAFITQLLLKQTHVNHRHAGQILSAVKSICKPFAHVSLVILVLRQHVVLSVYRIMNVLKMRVAAIRNVVIHVLELVELMQNVKL